MFNSNIFTGRFRFPRYMGYYNIYYTRILEREKEEEDRIKKEEEKFLLQDEGKKKKNMSIKDKSKRKKSDDTYLKDEVNKLTYIHF